MTSKELINIIVRNGWNMVRQKGSHVHFKKLQSGNLVTIPHPVLYNTPQKLDHYLMIF